MSTETPDGDARAYIRRYYDVPAEVGMRVMADGQLGTIEGFEGAYLVIRLDGQGYTTCWHPSWRILYPAVKAEDS